MFNSPVSLQTEQAFEMPEFKQSESFMNSSLNLEEIVEKKFEGISSDLLEIDPASPFADTDLVLLKDSFSGLMPLNGIKETELKEIENLFTKIKSGQAQLEIDPTDVNFFKETQKDIKKLLTRKIGRKLIATVCENSKKTTIVKCFLYRNEQGKIEKLDTPHYLGERGKVIHNINNNKLSWAIGINQLGKSQLFILPRYMALGHELVHATSKDIYTQIDTPPVMGKSMRA